MLRDLAVLLVFTVFLTISVPLVQGARVAEITYSLPLEDIRRHFLQVIQEISGGDQAVKADSNNIDAQILDLNFRIRFIQLDNTSTKVEVNGTASDPDEAATMERLVINLVQARLAKDIKKGFLGSGPDLSSVITQYGRVAVCIFGAGDNHIIQTSGVVISPNGLILTTTHDIKSADHIIIQLFNGTVGQGRILASDKDHDLALLESGLSTPEYMDLYSAKKTGLLSSGVRIWTIGCPLGLADTSAQGTITAPPRLIGDTLLLQSDLPVYPGSSGSPVFDAQGRLVALVKGRIIGQNSISFLIPSFYAMALFTKEKFGSAGKDTYLSEYSPKGANNWLIRALASRKFDTREHALLNAIKADSTSTTALYYLGALYSTRPDKIQQEKDIWNRLASLHPDWGEIHFRMGNCLFRSGKLQQAERSYRIALKYLREDPRVYNNLGEILRREKRFKPARKAFRQALAINPDYPSAHYNLGVLYDRDLKQPEQAIYHYRQYLKLKPQATDALQVRQWLQKLEQGL
jgi:S1-C subfamily serine protease/Tfp pilus assembly protein PilF